MADAAARGAPLPPRAVPLWLMRVVVTVHALGIFIQPLLAGQFLAGNFDFVEAHGTVGELTEVVGLFQIPIAVLLRWPGNGPLWPLGASVLVFLAEVPQVFLGYTGALAVHVPLGVALFGAMLLLLIWVWRPRLGAPAARRSSSTSTDRQPSTAQ